MASVTQRVKMVKQPECGYLPISSFKKIELKDNNILFEEENISPNLVGLVVDYMTRYIIGTPKEKAFEISILGASIINEKEKCLALLDKIIGLTNESILCACKIVGYDVCYRADPTFYKSIDNITPDSFTISNIAIMIKRSLSFFESYGPIVADGITFEEGYTSLIDSGDGDFITKDTLWDFKVTKNNINPQHTLQILVYYLMAMHSQKDIYKSITKIGFFNPRKNIVYIKSISEIDPNILTEIEHNVIGYNSTPSNQVNTNSQETFFSITDVMKILHCTRYMVMKYYSEEDLPLIKKNNKYLISKTKLYEWIDYKEKQENKKFILSLIAFICILIIVFISFLFFKS